MSGLVTLRKIPLGPPEELQPRPRLRSECKDGPRPCPWLGCRHHLGNDEHDGIVRVDVSRLRNTALPTCSLDVAEGKIEGVPQIMDIEQISGLMGIWHTNAEEALASAEEKLRNDKDLWETWLDAVDRNHGHPLDHASQTASSDCDDDLAWDFRPHEHSTIADVARFAIARSMETLPECPAMRCPSCNSGLWTADSEVEGDAWCLECDLAYPMTERVYRFLYIFRNGG